MSDDSQTQGREDGFELGGRFYPWKIQDTGKDMMLIDKFSGLAITDFFEIVEDDHERGRGPILLTLIATSLRAGNPGWSVERITRTVMDVSLSDVEFVAAEEPAVPVPPKRPPAVGGISASPSNGSSSQSTPAETSESVTSPATPV